MLIVTTLGAAILCFFYSIGSIALWIAGAFRLWWWLKENWKKKVEEKIPEAMAGQEKGSHWETAWDLANLRNHGISADCKLPHFNVIPFLKSKTGLDMRHLAHLTISRDETSKVEEELVRVDRELACAPLDLEYLSQKAERRVDGAAGGVSGETDGRGVGDGRPDNEQLEMELMLEIVHRFVTKTRDAFRKQACASSTENESYGRDGGGATPPGGAGTVGSGGGGGGGSTTATSTDDATSSCSGTLVAPNGDCGEASLPHQARDLNGANSPENKADEIELDGKATTRSIEETKNATQR